MTQTRRLAAILAADVAGYSRLMGADEEGTLERLKALRRELFDPKIAEHQGRIVKTTGDGMLVEFASVVDAVRCAVEVQRAIPGREAGVAADNRIELRIGINLGDVIVEGDDLYGDGVNIAARIEALADAGGVFVSNTVHDHVRDRVLAAIPSCQRAALTAVVAGTHGQYSDQRFADEPHRSEPLQSDRFGFGIDSDFVTAYTNAMAALENDADAELPNCG